MPQDSGKKRGSCFQCSKRRIACDAGEPTCQKCLKKGIECSGLGRFRFSAGIARRGRLKGCTIPVADLSPELAFEKQPFAEKPGPLKIRWKDANTPVSKGRGKRKRLESAIVGGESSKRRRSVEDADRGHERSEMEMNDSRPVRNEGEQDNLHPYAEEIDFDEILRHGQDQLVVQESSYSICPWIVPFSAHVRKHLSYFADEIAPVMVLLDKVCNGYRDIILPMACEDDLVQRTVISVTAQHVVLHQPGLQPAAEAYRAEVISRLRRDSLQAFPDGVFNLSAWCSLIVLLVGETVTGSSDYTYLLRALLSLARNIDQIPASSAKQFLIQQTHMFEFLGQPLLGESQGIEALRLPLDQYLDWACYDLPPESEYNRIVCLSRLAFMKASQLYVNRATLNQDQPGLLRDLRQIVSQVDPDEPGSHALVWVCFLAAADSKDPEQREYFTDRMNRIFTKTRFENIRTAVRSLPALWERQGSGRWTEDLIRLAPTLVM